MSTAPSTIHVVSLQRTPERLVAFRQHNPTLRYQRFDAVDGLTLDRDALVRDGLLQEPGLYAAGALGAALSMRTLWQHIMNSGQPATLVEDDALLHPDFEGMSQRLLQPLGNDWDMVAWGWNFDALLTAELMPGLDACTVLCNQDALRGTARAFLDAPAVHRSLHKLHHLFGGLCYSVSPRGAAKLLQCVFPIRAMALELPGYETPIANYGFDCALNALYASNDCHVCFPPLALSFNDHAESTIQAST